jgi:hypothetical protein
VLRRIFSCLLASSVNAWARRDFDPGGCAGCGTCGGFFLFIVVGLIALHIAILVWVARDAKSRGLDNAILWMVLVIFMGVIGLIIYLLARPQGPLVRCATCGNSRMAVSARCPYCGNA